jgi:hypothetical protein
LVVRPLYSPFRGALYLRIRASPIFASPIFEELVVRPLYSSCVPYIAHIPPVPYIPLRTLPWWDTAD